MAPGGGGDGADGVLRAAIATLGGLALVVALVFGLAGHSRHLRAFLVVWAVLTPYWWWLEYRFFPPPDPSGQAQFITLQRYSQLVWLGGMVALATLIWR